MEVSSSDAQTLFPMVLSLRKQGVPFEVGMPVAAHVAAEAIQRKDQPLKPRREPFMFLHPLHGKIPLFKRSLNLSRQCKRKESHSPWALNVSQPLILAACRDSPRVKCIV